MRFCGAVVIVVMAGCTRPPATMQPVVTVAQLMDATVHPSAEVIFESVGTIISEKGTEEIFPRTAEKWDDVKHAAITLAEAGNLLQMTGRAKDQGEWMNRAHGLTAAAMTAVKAVEAKNAEALFEAGGVVYEACVQCHDQYKKSK